jgi:hypothetical protein
MTTKGYSASDRATAVRCVDCPICHQKAGEPCILIRFRNVRGYNCLTVTHKSRVDKFYEDTYGPNSEAAKELNAGVTP